MARQKKLKKLSPTLVHDKAARDNFEQSKENFVETFTRMDKKRWAVSDGNSGSFSTSEATNWVYPENLTVQLSCTGKHLVQVCLNQTVDVSIGAIIPAGGISVQSGGNNDTYGIIVLENQTKGKIVSGTQIGVYAGTVVSPASAISYFAPGCINLYDKTPVEGVNTYAIKVKVINSNNALLIVRCELIAHELF